MWRLIPLALAQSICLAGGQVLLKFALMRMGSFCWTRAFFVTLFTNWWFMACGICFGIASVLWMYIIKNFPFSMAYPMVSLSYVFGMIAAIMFFHEQVTLTRWLGVLLIMLGCCLTSTNVNAQTQHKALSAAEQSALVQRINKAVSTVKTLQCNFTQTKRLSLLKDEAKSQGVMYYAQGGRLRWEYTQPTSYIFVMKDNHVTIKAANKKNVIDVRKNKMFQEITRIMMSSITGECLTDTKTFVVKTFITADGTYMAELTPQKKEMRQMFRTIRLHFNKAENMVSRVEMIESKGDVTVIDLKDEQTNKTLDESVFTVD